ncbi:MAG: hypothetical protein WD532_06730 [Acidimicrobiia bacterium]
MSQFSKGQRMGRSAGLALFAVVGFFYLASGLVVPTWPWLIILNVVGVFALVMTIRLSAERWWMALVGPLAAMAFWYLYVNLGGALGGWTA